MKNVTEFISELRSALKKNFAMYDKVWVERFRKFDSELMFSAIVALCLDKDSSNSRLIYDRLFSLDLATSKEFSASSFSKARRRLPFELFVDISQWIYNFHQIPEVEKWLGMNVFAIDGTVIDLPSELEQEGFSSHNEAEFEGPQAMATVLYDLQKGMVYDAIVSQHFDERATAKFLLKSLPCNSLLICDRGYNSFDFFYDAEDSGVKVLLRMPEAQAPEELCDFIKSAEVDEILTMTLSMPTQRKVIRRNYIPRPITVRAIKYFRGGQRFIAVTTLLDDGIEFKTLASMYWCRWDIEECFKLEKQKMRLEDFRCKHTQGILQEFWAVQLLQNLSRALVICRSNFRIKLKERTEISMFGVFKILKLNLFKLISREGSELAVIVARLETALRKITHKFRPDRQYPRRRVS